MADTYKALNKGMQANHDQLEGILDETRKTTDAMKAAYELMEEVPKQRKESLSLARDTCELLKKFTSVGFGEHKQQLDNQGRILEKLDNQ